MIKSIYRIILLLSTLMVITGNAYAIQILEGVDGETLLGKISLKEQTRISVSGARIKKWFFNEGEFILEKDVDNGQIFVKPAIFNKPLNIFITDDRGNTYTLLLEITDLPAENIIIKDKAQARLSEPSEIEDSEPYERIIKNMTLAMALDAAPRGLEIREVHRDVLLWKESKFILNKQYIGKNVVGERYLLVNVSDKPMVIAEQELFRNHVLAVSVEHGSLQPGDSTAVYIVREKNENE